MPQSEATREVLWNISHVWAMYAMFIVSLAIAGYGIYRRAARWRRGAPERRFDQPGKRLRLLLLHALGQKRTAREPSVAFFHSFLFYGFLILTVATTVVMLDYDFGLPVMRGAFYLYFQSFLVDVFGVLTLIGVGAAAIRRVWTRPDKLIYTDEALLILLAVFLITFTGFLVEGWRIAAVNDPWGRWSPFGYLVARASRSVFTDKALLVAHGAVWWTHATLVFGFIAWAPFTKMMHVLTGPLNIYTASLKPSGASLKKLDFDRLAESGEPMGVRTLSEFSWKDLLDLDACTECGRCTAVCPAHTVGKALSPRDLILDLRGFLHNPASLEPPGEHNHQQSLTRRLEGASPERLWSCTTCGACVEACPVFIEQMPKIVDLRRFLVMEESDYPATMAEAVSSLEARNHPFRGAQSTRLDWTQGLNIKTMAELPEAKEAEVLFWVGCGGALIDRNQKVIRATAQLLQAAGVRFSILGREEKCTGDPARRIGNEFLFEMFAKENIQRLDGYGVKKIVVSCPHCFNAFRNEYPEFGGRYEVYHHSEFLAKLVEEGRLKPSVLNDRKIAYHDPCYLGRHNGVFDAPRRLTQITSKNETLEMEQSRENAFCCGGGGGMSFVEEPSDKRVNQERARQALATGADTIAVACPFCMTMMEDGINARKGDREVKVLDIAELLWEAVEKDAGS